MILVVKQIITKTHRCTFREHALHVNKMQRTKHNIKLMSLLHHFSYCEGITEHLISILGFIGTVSVSIEQVSRLLVVLDIGQFVFYH